jgi:hypothetical protein
MEGSAVFLIQKFFQSRYILRKCRTASCQNFVCPGFCKLHKQEVSRNVGEISLPPDYYQRVCQKSYCFCSSQVFII